MADTDGAGPTPYRVLARKYRPAHFGELIGQAPMVRTLRNAFAHGRIPQAWMLTGVRGVGKTTTARILARALNYQRDGEAATPSVDIETPGVHCLAIMEGRHVDVIEMDAASHTGVDNMRDLTDAARYKPVSAPYKVYIIDEVHMLSSGSFNALLKTLEEPPAHVKFIFATTEIRKVPTTILSRCQRFDLRRIETDELVAHLAAVAEKESVAASTDALRLVARAAEGSVRDALSLLDQAIAFGGGRVEADDLKAMLGLADRARVVDLFELVMKGDAAGALGELAAQYEVGADPAVVLTDLAAFTHQVTRLKVTNGAPDPGDPPEVRERAARFAAGLGVAALSQMWQALLAGIAEVQAAGKPLMAAEMVLIRLCYLATLVDPEPMALGGGTRGVSGPSRNAAPAERAGTPVARAAEAPVARSPEPQRASEPPPQETVRARTAEPAKVRIESFAELAAAVGAANVKLKHAVERDIRLKRFEPGRIEVSLNPGAAPTLAGELTAKLKEITGERWVVTVSDGATAPTLREAYEESQFRAIAAARDEPLVKALLDQFADAEVTAVRDRRDDTPATDAPRARGEATS